MLRSRQGRMTVGAAVRLLLALATAAGIFTVAPPPARADGPAPDKATAKYEIDFMTGMIDHHAMAVMTAEMCVARATHEELRALCQNIITTQSQEIEMMQSWLRDWYGISYEPRVKDGGQMKKLSSLFGAEFEIEFMRMMIEHHLKAIKEASACVERVYHEELRTLCENIITAQAAEIEQMRTWLCQWYGICKRGR